MMTCPDCRIVTGHPRLTHPDAYPFIQFCPLHDAAPDLLAVCKGILDAAACNLALRMVIAKTSETYQAFIQLSEVIDKAKGK